MPRHQKRKGCKHFLTQIMHLTQQIESQSEDLYFNSIKQRSVARSITEAGYIALSMASRQLIWTHRVVSIIEGTLEELAVPLLFGDNKVFIQVLKGVSKTAMIKHIDKSFHQVVDKVKKGSMKLFWVLGEEILADVDLSTDKSRLNMLDE